MEFKNNKTKTKHLYVALSVLSIDFLVGFIFIFLGVGGVNVFVLFLVANLSCILLMPLVIMVM